MATIGTLFRTLGERLHDWRERQKAIAELRALDDRTLADIGLRRSDIPFAVYYEAGEAGLESRAVRGNTVRLDHQGGRLHAA